LWLKISISGVTFKEGCFYCDAAELLYAKRAAVLQSSPKLFEIGLIPLE
jgi:hypothetical protein